MSQISWFTHHRGPSSAIFLALALLGIGILNVGWLDEHAGSITALSTIVLVVVTGMYVWLTSRLVEVVSQQSDAAVRREKRECAEIMRREERELADVEMKKLGSYVYRIQKILYLVRRFQASSHSDDLADLKDTCRKYAPDISADALRDIDIVDDETEAELAPLLDALEDLLGQRTGDDLRSALEEADEHGKKALSLIEEQRERVLARIRGLHSRVGEP